MGCCSSSKSVAHSVSPTSHPTKTPQKHIISQNTELVDHHQLQQHHNINQGLSATSEDELPSSFANNKSIMNEVMRLEEIETNNEEIETNKEENNMEIKSNENSENVQFNTNYHNKSFGEFATHTINVDPESPSHHENHEKQDIINNNIALLQDSYHPFGLVQTQREDTMDTESCETKENLMNNENKDQILDLEALYAENLKEHGFDINKFRTANILMTLQNDTKQSGLGSGLSSFASSQMSSQKTNKSEHINDKENNTKIQIYNNNNIIINEFISEEEDEEDFMMEELSKSIPNPKFEEESDDDVHIGYIESFKHSVKKDHEINNVMDDQDEELMDAILSLDLED